MGWDLRFHSLPPGVPVRRLLNKTQEAGTRTSNNNYNTLLFVLLLPLHCLRPYCGGHCLTAFCREQGRQSLPRRTVKTRGSVNAASQIKAVTHARKDEIKPRDCHVLVHNQLCSASKAACCIRERQQATAAGHTHPDPTADLPRFWLNLRFCAFCH